MAATKTVEIGAKQLFGVSNQNLGAEVLVTVQMYTRVATGGTYPGTLINSGTASLNIQTMDAGQFSDSKTSKNQVGATSTLLISDEGLSLKLSVIPEGATTDNDLAAAILAASCPPKGAYCTLTNAPVMAFGPFTAADNSAGGAFNSKQWQVQSANLRFIAGDRAVVDLELMQYVSAAMRPVP